MAIHDQERLNNVKALLVTKFPANENRPQLLDDFLLANDSESLFQVTQQAKSLTPNSWASQYVRHMIIRESQAITLNRKRDLKRLDKGRQHLVKQTGIYGVTAHRGDGATFDKIGGRPTFSEINMLYPHHKENSEASTLKFIKYWKKPNSNLSGIECDVFFSSDNVPYVTHNPYIYAVMKQETPSLNPLDINQDIRKTLSLFVPDRIMKLERWLQLLFSIEDNLLHLEVPKRGRLRLEIEMKDPIFNNDNGSWEVVEELIRPYLVNKKTSYFYEVCLFNNSPAPSSRAAATINDPILSRITYAEGGSLSPSDNIRALRYGLHMTGIIPLIKKGGFDNKIVTFAPGLEHPGPKEKDEQLYNVGWCTSQALISIEQALQSARFDKIITAINSRFDSTGKRPLKIRILTDHGDKGAKTFLEHKLYSAEGDKLGFFDICRFLQRYKLNSTESNIAKVILGNTVRTKKERSAWLLECIPKLL